MDTTDSDTLFIKIESEDEDKHSPNLRTKKKKKCELKATNAIKGAKPLICEFPGCNLQFSRPSRLLTHNRIHTGLFNFIF